MSKGKYVFAKTLFGATIWDDSKKERNNLGFYDSLGIF